MVKNLPANIGDTGSNPGSGRSPGEMATYPIFLPGKSRGQGTLATPIVHGVARLRHNLATRQQQHLFLKYTPSYVKYQILETKSKNAMMSHLMKSENSSYK